MNIIIIYLVSSLLSILEFLFLARAIMSWFVQGSGSKIYEFLCMATEPLIQPFRVLLSRIDALRNSPFDFAFILAFFVLIALQRVLYMF
nr:YggT family protein [uncultured Agathobaculum sp.]